MRKINYKKVQMALLMMVLGTTMYVVPAFADSTSAGTMMANLISLMCSMFKYVGGAIFVWAIIQFVLATKRSDADSKADAVQTAVCGIALMGISAIVTGLGVMNNIGGGEINSDVLDGSGS